MTFYKNIYRLFLILLFLILVSASAQLDEYTIKAVFIEKLTRFIEWPKESFMEDTTKSFNIVILGNNPFGDKLEKIYSNRKIRNKQVIINYINSPKNIPDCHLIFISNSMENKLDEILSQTKDKPILLVGDTKNYSKKGVYINFYTETNKISFEINEAALKQSGLKISHLLLRQARVING